MSQDEESIKFYDTFGSVRRLYQDIATWTGVSQELILAGDLPQEQGLRNSVLAIRSIALQTAVHDVLAAEGVRPALVMALSLGISCASGMTGALSQEEMFRMLWHRRHLAEPGPGGPAQAVAFGRLRADGDLDLIRNNGREGIYVGVDFGPAPDGSARNVMLSGYREALERLAAEDPNVTMGAGTTGKHSPLRTWVSDFLRDYVRTLPFRDPAIPLVTCLDDRVHTTAGGVRDALWRNDSSAASVPAGIRAAIQAGVTMFIIPGPSAATQIMDFPVPVLVVREPDDIEAAVTAASQLPASRPASLDVVR